MGLISSSRWPGLRGRSGVTPQMFQSIGNSATARHLQKTPRPVAHFYLLRPAKGRRAWRHCLQIVWSSFGRARAPDQAFQDSSDGASSATLSSNLTGQRGDNIYRTSRTLDRERNGDKGSAFIVSAMSRPDARQGLVEVERSKRYILGILRCLEKSANYTQSRLAPTSRICGHRSFIKQLRTDFKTRSILSAVQNCRCPSGGTASASLTKQKKTLLSPRWLYSLPLRPLYEQPLQRE